MTNNETFVRISNKEIYLEIKGLHDKIDDIHSCVKETNGKTKVNQNMIKTNQKIIYGLITGLLALLGWLFVLTLHI